MKLHINYNLKEKYNNYIIIKIKEMRKSIFTINNIANLIFVSIENAK
jgi:hypothetical protein